MQHTIRRHKQLMAVGLAAVAAGLVLAVAFATGNPLGASPTGQTAMDPVRPHSPTVSAIFLKIEGIEGESTDRDHRGWSEVLSFDHSIDRPIGGATGSARESGAARVGEVVVTKRIDKATPQLWQGSLSAKRFETVEIYVTRQDGDQRVGYFTYTLKDVIISSYSVGGHGYAEPVPSESISFNFAEIKVTYTPQDETGRLGAPVEYSWNIARNAP